MSHPMSTRNVLGLVAIPLLGLAALSGSCKSPEATGLDAAARPDRPTTGGKSGTGGSAGAGGGQTGMGGHESGGSGGGQGGAEQGGASGSGGASTGKGGSSGKDAAAGGNGGAGRGGSSGKDAGRGGASPIDGGPIECDDIESPGRLAVYFYDDSAVSGSSIQMHFDIVNFTAFSSRMQQVTVRYWFTDEDPSSANVVEQYYVPLPTTMKFVTLNPQHTGANTVLEMSFANAPDAGASWVETKGFNFAFHKASYAGTYDQSDDYSYDPKLTKALGQNPRITAYVNGVLSWGCEPPVGPAEPLIDAGFDDGAVRATDALAGNLRDALLQLDR
jgi:hypothetical protein